MLKNREILVEHGYEDVIIFENPDFDDAIIGIDELNQRVIYDYDKMIESLMSNDEMSQDDAIEWIEYNTLRAIPYMGDNAPIVMYSIKNYE